MTSLLLKSRGARLLSCSMLEPPDRRINSSPLNHAIKSPNQQITKSTNQKFAKSTNQKFAKSTNQKFAKSTNQKFAKSTNQKFAKSTIRRVSILLDLYQVIIESCPAADIGQGLGRCAVDVAAVG